jgi:hypothetical protein
VTERELVSLITEWAWLLDHGRAEELVELITPDGEVLGLGEPLLGHGGLLTWAQKRSANTSRRTQHQISNFRFAPAGDGRATGHVSIVLRVVDERSPAPREDFVGEYHDEYVATSEGWRFARRVLVALGS